MLYSLPFPVVDPVAFAVGPLVIRWYALAYLAGFLLGGWYARQLLRQPWRWPGAKPPLAPERIFDLVGVIALGVVLGGRLGFVLFYAPAYFAANPLQILMIWQGGMSFHGGLIGAVLAAGLFLRTTGGGLLGIGDLLACAAPIGLFFGRLANFVNGELWGRASELPWAIEFPAPAAGGIPRHPSQLYEAALEGVVLFLAVNWLARQRQGLQRPGLCAGVFLIGYGVFRSAVELLREPDFAIGFLYEMQGVGVTMGMVLSAPMLLAGLWLVWQARARASA